ncbi:uncharacterized protein LOC143997771 [Lithobates pipiens]
MTHSCDLRVSGIPTSPYEDDLVLDKLLIHFLHRKNGGSGEVEVRYPTRERGVAMLTFDQVEVAEQVLTRTHQLEIRNHTYPLEVSRPQRQRTQFSMPITTTLSLEYFDDRSEVIALLEKQGLKVYREESSYLFIEGDFRDLSRCRDELYKTMRSCSHQVENRMSRRDHYQLKEHSKDRGRVAGIQIPIDSMPDKTSYKTSNRKPSPIRTKITEPLPAENDGYSSTGDRSRQPYIKPSLISNGSSQRRSKDTSSSDSASIRKYPNIAANLHFHPTPPTKGPTDEDRTGKNSPLPSNGKPADSLELTSHVALPGTQFKEDLPGSRQLKHTFAGASSSSQSKPKDNISDGFISNQKYPNSTTGDGSDFNPGQPKNTSTNALNSNRKHSTSTIEGSTKFNSGQPKNTSIDELNSSPNHSKSSIGDGTKFSSGQPKKTSMDEFNSSPNHSKSSTGDGTKFSSGQPKNTSTNALNSNRKHSNSTIEGSTTFNSGQPKNTSVDEFNSRPNYSKSSTGDGTKFNSGQHKNTSTDEINSNTSHSKSTIGDGTKFSSGQPKNTSTNALNSNRKHSNSTIEGSTTFNSGQPKNTSVDEFNSRPNYSKSPTGDGTKFNSGQHKNTSTDEINSNTSHSKSTIGDGTKFSSGQPNKTSTEELSSSKNHSKSTISDSTKFNSGQPKNISTGELNSNPNHSKSTLGNVKPGKPQNSSPDEFHLNPRNLEDLTARPSNPSSLMATGWSSSSSPTGNSLTAINPKNHLDESSLSTDLLVDPAVHTYVSVFMKDAIDDILSLSDAEITTEKGEGYNRVILTSKSPHLSRLFYKAAHEISDIFIKYQHILRFQSIELSNISADRTKNLQSYLFRCGIWSLANEKRLQMIGPNEDLTRFMEEWTSAGGDFVRFVHSVQGVSPASSRPPVVGMDNVHQATTHSHNVAHDVQRARPRHHSAESGARGGTRRTNSTNRSNFPFNKSWK